MKLASLSSKFVLGISICLSLNPVANAQVPVYPADFSHPALSPPLGIRWIRLLGGSHTEYPVKALPAPGGGLLITGYTVSTDGDFSLNDGAKPNVFITRLTPEGTVIWTRMLKGSNYDAPISAAQSANGDWLISGITLSSDFDFDGQDTAQSTFVTRVSDSGEVIWVKTLYNDRTNSPAFLVPTPDGGCALNVGIADSDGWTHPNIIKLDANGSMEWTTLLKTIQYGGGLAVAHDGGYWIAGEKDSANNQLIGLIRLNDQGDSLGTKTIWISQWESVRLGTYRGIKLFPSQFGGYWIMAEVYTNAVLSIVGIHSQSFRDIAVMKLDQSGNKMRQHFYGGSRTEYGFSLVERNDGSIVIGASSNSNDGNLSTNLGGTDGWVASADSLGNMLWQQSIGTSTADEIDALADAGPDHLFAVGMVSSRLTEFSKDTLGAADVFIARIGSSNYISGDVFFDSNKNGLRDVGENGLTGLPVNSLKQGINGKNSLSSLGHFMNSVDTGTYQTSISVNPAYFSVSPASIASNFENYGNVDTLQFAVSSLSEIYDLGLHLAAARLARPGRDYPVALKIRNQGTQAIDSVVLKFHADSLQQIISSSPSATVLANDTLQWTLGTLQPFDTGSVYVLLHNAMPPELDAGDTLKLWAALSGDTLADATPDDNIIQFAMPVTNSFDPNDKSEKHGGRLSPQQAAGRDWLEYTIRFQNTGTDTAFRVIVSDSLEGRLDPKTVEVIAASHPCDFTIENDRILKWTFNDILLPDSNRNEPASHGYVLFRIRPKAGLNAGDSISNYAGIWFDFNAPVYTGRQWTKVTVTGVTAVDNLDPRSRQIKFYPIPGRETTWMEASGITATRMGLQLYDLQGRLMYSADLGPQSGGHFRRSFNWTRLPAGLYVIVVQIDRKTFSYKMLLE